MSSGLVYSNSVVHTTTHFASYRDTVGWYRYGVGTGGSVFWRVLGSRSLRRFGFQGGASSADQSVRGSLSSHCGSGGHRYHSETTGSHGRTDRPNWRHPGTQIVLDFETPAHAKTHYHRYQLRTGTNRQCHGRMQSELWCVPLSSNTLSLSSRDVCAALSNRIRLD